MAPLHLHATPFYCRRHVKRVRCRCYQLQRRTDCDGGGRFDVSVTLYHSHLWSVSVSYPYRIGLWNKKSVYRIGWKWRTRSNTSKKYNNLPFWICATLRDTSPMICRRNFSAFWRSSHSVARNGRRSCINTCQQCHSIIPTCHLTTATITLA